MRTRSSFVPFGLVVVSAAFGCGPQQSDVCAEYVDCATTVIPEGAAALLAAYGPEGSCWEDQDLVKTCNQACRTGLEDTWKLYPKQDACLGGGPSDSQEVFDEEEAWKWGRDDDCDFSGRPALDLDWVIHPSDSKAFAVDMTLSHDEFTADYTADCELSGVEFTCDEPTGLFAIEGDFDIKFETGDAVFEGELGDGSGEVGSCELDGRRQED